MAAEDVSLTGVISNGNAGPSVQSLFGAIRISIGGTEKTGILEVMENQGHGIFAGTELGFVTDGESEDGDDESGHGIAITSQIKVRDNGAWGILSISGDVFVNVDQDGLRTLPGLISEISGNGNPDLNCLILGEEGDPVTPEDGCNNGGGVGAPGGNVYLARVGIRHNLGLGVAAAEDIKIRGIEVHYNQGPGIQSLFGSITIAPGGGPDEEGIFINNNEGPGIFTSTDTLFDPGDIESDSEEIPLQSIIVKAPLKYPAMEDGGYLPKRTGTFSLTWTPPFGRVAYSRWKASSAKMGIRTMAACFLMTPGSWWHRRASATPGVWAPVKVTFSPPLWTFLPTTDPVWPSEETLTSEKVISAETHPT